ncbi:MAG TPA: DoxX family protein [Verrucomicrobiae bacterium]|jgi:putative oxidoreductase
MADKAKSPGPGLPARAYAGFIIVAGLLRSPLLLLIRLYWGWQFHLTGAGKLKNLEKTTQFFQSLHIPLPHLNAVIVSLTEMIGGLMLILGLGSRAFAAVLAFDMIVAFLTADIDKVKHIWDQSDKFVSADPFLFLFACAIIVAFGPGIFSVDALVKRRRQNGGT